MKTALITGSTKGIGKATAIELAKLNWRVIIHGRKLMECEDARREIIAASGNSRIEIIASDLSEVSDVIQMATEIKSRFSDISVLILNAGTFGVSRKITKDGLELTWMVNYFSRFILVDQLLDLLKTNAPSRIIDVSGMYHKKGSIHFDDLTLENNYTMSKAINQSKLANVLYTHKLAQILKGSNVTINTLHPGAVNSGSILRSAEFSKFAKMMYRISSIFFKSTKSGSSTIVYLASSPEVEGLSGKYLVNKKQRNSSIKSQDIQLQDKLWTYSMSFLKNNTKEQI